ncbi:flagellar motility protein MotE (MotC chaperone) [Geomicrobium halophilum]|uniref:Flagellar motility protein MotE (MotC chaperone) n=1 Tax=Geomicrobium halophilum TaxID=549000 RepID=A0A841PQ31_9BACL|nr:MotE family protein [Geomicrobium halophilum]MBB6449296.1 flagellar motility protein MotE (MotC chaperone) [Geomicrobium halophilum]
MAKNKNDNPHWFQKLLFLIVIPGTLIIVLVGVVLTIFGVVNPIDQIKSTVSSIPVVSDWVHEDEKEEESEPRLAEKDEQIAHLEYELQQAESTIEDLQIELAQYEELEALSNENQDAGDIDTQEELSRIANVYENMNPRRAAEIMGELPNEEILMHMSEMNDDSRSDILQNMDPNRAAEITTLLAN